MELKIRQKWPDLQFFPVNFPVIRELGGGDRFNRDCVLSQPQRSLAGWSSHSAKGDIAGGQRPRVWSSSEEIRAFREDVGPGLQPGLTAR
jgi:hypothetical protein